MYWSLVATGWRLHSRAKVLCAVWLFGLSLPIPKRQIRHDKFLGMRVGEASHPGPGGSRRTARVRKEHQDSPGLSNLCQMLLPLLESLLVPLLEKMLVDMIGKFGGADSGLMNLLSGVKSEVQKKEKRKRKRKKESKTLVQEDRRGDPAPSNVVSVPSKSDSSQDKHAAQPVVKDKPHAGSAKQVKPSDDGWTQVSRKKPPSASLQWALRSQDWDAPVVSFQDVGAKLDECQQEFVAVILCSESEVDTLKAILQGFSKPYRVLTVCLGAKLGSQRVPGQLGDRLVFKDAAVKQFLSAKGAQAPQPKAMVQNAVKVEKKPSVVIVARAFQKFLPESDWARVKASPQKFFHEWLLSREVRALDSWGWKAERSGPKSQVDKFFGLARILKDDLETLMAASGNKFFIDPAKDNRVECAVTWVNRTPEETDLEYLDRATRLGGTLGLVAGVKTLGSRCKSTGPTSRVWLMETVPNEWDQEQVKTVLSSVFKDVALIRQRCHHSGMAYWFKGAVDGANDVVPVPFMDGDGVITLWARWAPPRNQPVQQRNVRSSNTFDLRPKSILKASTAVVQTGTTADGQGNGETKEVSSAKRAKASVRQIPDGLVKEDCPQDGACLFHAFRAGLVTLQKSSDKKEVPHVRELRAAVCQHLTRHADKYKDSWDGKKPDKSSCPDWATYVEAIGHEKAWGSEMELAALCRLYDVRCILIPEQGIFPPMVFHPKQCKRVIVVWYTGAHCDLLVPEGGKAIPKELMDVTTTPVTGIRMGGRSSSACSARTKWTASSKPVVSAHTVWTKVSESAPVASSSSKPPQQSGLNVKVSAAPPTGAASIGSNDYEQVSDIEEAEAGSSGVVPSKYVHNGRSYTWRCDFCPLVLEVSSVKSLYKRRWDHLNRWHKEETWGRQCAKPQVRLLKSSETVGWQCPCCKMALSSKDIETCGKHMLRDIKQQHAQSKHSELSKAKWNGLMRVGADRVSLRQKRRITSLNVSAARMKKDCFGAHSVSPFTWPRVAKNRGVYKVQLCRAWRCDLCGLCASNHLNRFAKPCDPAVAKPIRTSDLQFLERDFEAARKLNDPMSADELNKLWSQARQCLTQSP